MTKKAIITEIERLIAEDYNNSKELDQQGLLTSFDKGYHQGCIIALRQAIELFKQLR